MKYIFILLLALALPLAEVARFPFSEIAVTLLDVATAATVFLWFFQKKRVPQSNLTKPIAIFISILIISLIANITRLKTNELLVSSLYLIRWIFYTLLYFTVLDLSSIRKKISKAMIAGGTIIIALGFVQYFLYSDLRNLRYAGWDEHLYRLFSTFLDPNFAGSFFVLYFLFVSNQFNFKKKITLILPVLTLIAIFLTFSRSSYIMLVVAIIVYTFLKKLVKASIVFTILVILSILLISNLTLKSEGTNLLRTASGEARLDSIKNAITIFKDHPIFGVGFNAYRYAQRYYGFLNESKQSLRSGELKMIIHSGAGTDNSFLFVLATSGIIGFAAFLYLLFNVLSVKEPLIRSSIVALMVNSLFINSLFYPPIMLWIWVLLGTAGRQVRSKNT